MADVIADPLRMGSHLLPTTPFNRSTRHSEGSCLNVTPRQRILVKVATYCLKLHQRRDTTACEVGNKLGCGTFSVTRSHEGSTADVFLSRVSRR